MTQLSPTTIAQSQATVLVTDLEKRYLSKEIKNPEDITRDLKTSISQFLENLGRPIFEFEPFVRGEPVLSEKLNRMFRRIQDDLNILAEQIDFIQAGSIFLFNYISTEILGAQRLNAQVSNKLKTLQLYSSAQDNDVIVFGDYFLNDDFIDLTKTPPASRASIKYPGHLTLAPASSSGSNNVLSNSKVGILDSSNGFIGNNQELDLKSFDNLYMFFGEIDTQKDLTFLSEVDRHADLQSIIDQKPETWIEYEYYRVSLKDRSTALGFNFQYRKPDSGGGETKVDWASGPGFTVEGKANPLDDFRRLSGDIGHPMVDLGDGEPIDIGANRSRGFLDGENDRGPQFGYVPGANAGVLKLDLQIELEEIKKINTITFTPYPLQDNKNYPVLVEKVETSEDASVWVPIQPRNVWIANEKNLETARIADDSVVGSGVWLFPDRSVKYIRFQIRQKYSIDAPIGHIYWETKEQVVREYVGDKVNVGIGESGGSGGGGVVETTVGGERAEGPIPTTVDPTKYNDPRYTATGNLVKKVEQFDGRRWAIGIRDIDVNETLYNPKGAVVSNPYRINGIIDRVAIEAEIDIPSTFSSDEGEQWVKFYVSPDDGINWFPISRIKDDFLGIQEILAFNDPLPEEFREQGVAYHSVDTVVNSLRVKIDISRPSQSNDTVANVSSTDTDLSASSTPDVRWYKLKVRKR